MKNNIKIYNISNTASLFLVGELNITGFPIKFNIVGDRLYVLQTRNSQNDFENNKLLKINISDIVHPALMQELSLSDPNDFVINGNYAYIADNGENALRIASLDSMSILGAVDTDQARGVAYGKNNIVVVAAGPAGLKFIDVSNITSVKDYGFCSKINE